MAKRIAEFHTISLRQFDTTTTWTLRGDFTSAQLVGVMAGALFCLMVAAPNGYGYFMLDGHRIINLIAVTYNEVPGLQEFQGFPVAQPVGGLTRQLTQQITGMLGRENQYLVWVYTPTADYPVNLDRVMLFGFDDELLLREFLQGLFTMCDAFHIPREQALLAAPMRGDQNYRIEGVELPLLR